MAPSNQTTTPADTTGTTGTITYHWSQPNGTARVYRHPYLITFTAFSEPQAGTLSLHLLQAALVIAGLAGVYLT